jgi:hypothetical protein
VALTHFRRGHELGAKDPRSADQMAQWVKECERLAALDGKLPAVLSGKEQPVDAAERAEYAGVCQRKCLYAAATRLYQEAFTTKSLLAASPANAVRYNAASAAAQASCGAGEDAPGPTDLERVGLRKQALDWLRADLGAWRGLMEREAEKAAAVVAQQMQHWLHDPDFNGVRGPDALGQLPQAEREGWRQLWADVADTLARAQGKSAP